MRSMNPLFSFSAALACCAVGASFGCVSVEGVSGDRASAGPTSLPAGSVRPASPEEEIWALEEAYWNANRAADHERIAAAWHEEFLGWPDAEPRPIERGEGERFIRRGYARPGAFDFEIERAGIRVLGGVAVVHYAVHLAARDEEGRETRTTLRITHTLVREEGAWRILGGMSSRA